MKNGFTLIEMMIVLAILGILAAVIIPAISGSPQRDHQCKAGYKFTLGGQQIIGQNGGGVPCDVVSVPNGIGFH